MYYFCPVFSCSFAVARFGGARFWQQAEFDCKHAERCAAARKYRRSNYKWQ